MFRYTVLILTSLFVGLGIGYLVFFYPPVTSFFQQQRILPGKKVVGFLPYFLLNHAKSDYSSYVTTLTYFGLTVDTDGSILKMNNPQEEEPGWYALESGKAVPFLRKAQENGETLSLLVASGDQTSIDLLMSDPIPHAKKLISEVIPVMKRNHFTDLNIDIEKTGLASASAQQNFTEFIKTVKQELDTSHAGTVTIDVSPTDLIKHDLINVRKIAPFVDFLVIMGYDYHYTGSYVTGPVAPLYGAGINLEFDVATAVGIAKTMLPNEKIILGIPLYGYSWESILPTPQAAIIPSTGITESSNTISSFLSNCATCSAVFDFPSQEAFVIYKDVGTGTYHQIFYPTKSATLAKTQFAKLENLGGIALWALGYENSDILSPVSIYKNSF